MADFTLKLYAELLTALKNASYQFVTFEYYCVHQQDITRPFVILRHDVDKRAQNSLLTAQIEAGLNIKASYYFRVAKGSNNPQIIRNIVSLGHEIGYHYEDMSLFKGNTTEAYKHFQMQLKYFRSFYPVKTICMHGSPLSSYDGRALWNQYDYRNSNIIGEPYFDVDFDRVFYLTDTGRCWDGRKYSVRDKVDSVFSDSYHTTTDIIDAIKHQTFPSGVMINTHPQRWTDNKKEWLLEIINQTLKNRLKQIFLYWKY